MFTENTMMELLNKVIENDPVFCPNGCGHSYSGMHRKHSLKKHLVYACGKNPQFHCTYCQKKFRHKQSLQYHLSTVHQENIL